LYRQSVNQFEKYSIPLGRAQILGANLRPLQFVATENPFAMSSLAMPMPMSPIEMTPILAIGDGTVIVFRDVDVLDMQCFLLLFFSFLIATFMSALWS
jgi:hypothetical protein